MMKFKGIVLWVFAIIFTVSCDYIDNPIQGGGGGILCDKIVMRNILIDDFTGHRCVNCPEAAHEIEALKQNAQFKDRVIAIGVHTGFFSAPLGALYMADYRTNEGDNLNSIFGPSQFPIGMVNRTDYPGSHLKNYNDWPNIAATFLDSTSIFDIIPTINYVETTRSLQLDVDIEILRNVMGKTYNIVVFVTEDAIVSPQLTHTGTDTNYIHEHVLRTSTNSELGEPISSSQDFICGSILNYSSSSVTLDATWKENDCHVVVYIYDTTTQMIMQVVEESIL